MPPSGCSHGLRAYGGRPTDNKKNDNPTIQTLLLLVSLTHTLIDKEIFCMEKVVFDSISAETYQRRGA